MKVVILAGGSGTRLWPLSRTLMPKQFVKLFNAPGQSLLQSNKLSDKSLFQLTVMRNDELCESQFVVSNSEQYFLAVDQLEELEKEKNRYLLEPVGRNTAPAIALACMSLDKEDLVLVTPSDHIIKNEKEYNIVLKKAKNLSKDGYIVTFGIKPTAPETGFGYIEAEGENVKAFHEKPDIQTAKNYLNAGNYFWNSGMFCFKAGVFLAELEKYSPEIFSACKNALKNSNGSSIIRINHEDMMAIPSDSIDYAVMEKSDIVKVVPADIGWSDLGSFDSLYEQLPKDKLGNTVNEKYIGVDSKNNLILGNKRKITTIDIENLIVVDTGDALLISKKGSSQKVKQVVEKIGKNSDLSNIHLTAYRPWGSYTILENSLGYKIKRIEVKPGKRLSLQKHFHRNEHWIVVSGTATVTVGNEKKLIRPNESTYIKMGEVHRLENEGKIPVVLIEAQVGEYTGEDDIIRLDDEYGRK